MRTTWEQEVHQTLLEISAEIAKIPLKLDDILELLKETYRTVIK